MELIQQNYQMFGSQMLTPTLGTNIANYDSAYGGCPAQIYTVIFHLQDQIQNLIV